MDEKALSGVRVLDFTHFLAGPFGTHQLALQGAEVIKVEPIGGDGMRLTPISREWSDRGMGPAWMAVNTNKRSIAMDIRKPQAVEIVERLVTEMDVVCENFRPGVMERLGLGWSRLSTVNPALIYCAVSGFGSTGPERATASFDGKIQAMSGLMSITGNEESGPMRAGFAAADVTTGMISAFAVSSALYQRTRTGRGQFIDVAMMDSMLSFLGPQVAEYLVTDYRHPPFGNRSVSRKPTADRFRCGNGHIVLAVLTEKQFTGLMKTLGLDGSLSDPRFSDWYARMENADALRGLIESAMADGSPEEWARRLTEADVPCATIQSISQAVRHPQVVHRGLIEEAQTPFGPVRLVGSPYRMLHGTGGIDRPVARPGEHTDEILGALGYDSEQIDALRQAEVI